MHYINKLILVIGVALLASCASSKKVITIEEEPMPAVTIEEELLDTLTVSAPRLDAPIDYQLPADNPSATRTFDIIHTKLDLRFDWTNQHVIGKATLKLKPYFYPASNLILDAKGFEINKISLGNQEVKYDYDGLQIYIDLEKEYSRNQELSLDIDYIAKPSESPIGGSEAITSDQGLFFINHDGSEDKPQQIWTQGETENNSKWFPTIDKPNERCTGEVILTVQDRFETLSNGILKSSIPQENGMRTDTWVMDQSHAPYLFMIAVGEFSITREKWDGLDVEYYVEPDYKAYAKEIFNHTPEMLTFFSDKLDYKYPWQKYAQIVVRDYVSGAMENTTAVIFGDQVQKTDRELIDNDNDYIVAHELIHHWFGDLVTCESWANLTLNEGFANYGEYLWFEHKYGRDRAEMHRKTEQETYIQSVSFDGAHPLIHYSYEDKEDMFDAHSYNKGGLVLHMLRDYLGDDAFWASLNYYLNQHKNTAVEVDDLRLAFEDVTGQDLRFFFDQWYLDSGHPVLEVNHSFDTLANELVINISQTQNTALSRPVFQFPLSIDIYDKEKIATQIDTWIDDRSESIRIPAEEDAFLVYIDPQHTILSERIENFSASQHALILQNADNIRTKINTINALANNSTYRDYIIPLLNDPFYGVREAALNAIIISAEDQDMHRKIKSLALSDPHSTVRSAALVKLSNLDLDLSGLANQILEKEKAYPVIGSALQLLYTSKPNQALDIAKQLEGEKSTALLPELAKIYASSGDLTYLPFFNKNIHRVSDYEIFEFHTQYLELLQLGDNETIISEAENLKQIGLSKSESIYKKFAATNTINTLVAMKSEKDASFPNSPTGLQLINMIRLIIDAEDDPMLRKRYGLD